MDYISEFSEVHTVIKGTSVDTMNLFHYNNQ